MTDLDDLRAELDGFAQPEKQGGRSAREERIIAGFEEIQRFVEQHERTPQHGQDKDIFERLYAVRLDRLHALQESKTLLASLDHQGLLSGPDVVHAESVEVMDAEALLAELEGITRDSDITDLRHVRKYEEKRAAEEIEKRESCEDFDQFKLLFDAVKQDLKSGARQTRTFPSQAKAMEALQQGSFFITNGQMAYIAEVGEEFTTQYDRRDSRLRVIFDNKTQSRILLRSFQRALHRDAAARLITDLGAGPLFHDVWEEGDIKSGTIYVLRSLSSHPFVAEHRELLHKIGVTGGKVETRIANAEHDATYLLAAVEVVASYTLAGINRTKLEGLFHQIFAPAQLDLTINDRFGHPVRPREWFLVPLHVIDEAVKRILNGSITEVIYDPMKAQLVAQSQDEDSCSTTTDQELIDDYMRLVEDESGSRLEIGVVEWEGPHTPTLVWKVYRKWTKRPTNERLKAAQSAALEASRFFRTCIHCKERNNIGHMDEDICHGCAEQYFGVVH